MLCSFSADTPVLMADGTRKPISEVEVGDLVVATDPETGETGAREVEATLPHLDQLVVLRTSAGVIGVTEDHRFWNVTDEAWQEAQAIDAGEQLLSADGDVVTVEGLDRSTAHTAYAYDLTVADLHTFYVGTGDESALVHNCRIGELLSRNRSFSRGQRQFTLDQGNASGGWKHIFDRHVDPSRFVRKSKFPASFTEDDIVEILGQTIRHGKESSYAGNTVFAFRTNFKGQGFKTYRATLYPDGRVQTFHTLE